MHPQRCRTALRGVRQSPGWKQKLGNPGVGMPVPNKLGSLREARAPTCKELIRFCAQGCEQLAQPQCYGTPDPQLVWVLSSPKSVNPPVPRCCGQNQQHPYRPFTNLSSQSTPSPIKANSAQTREAISQQSAVTNTSKQTPLEATQ